MKAGLIYIDLGEGKNRLGGSALAQCYGQIGDESPDVENPQLIKDAFNAIQNFIDKGLILSGHDRSDGGLIVTLLEMAFGGNCGIDVDIKQGAKSTEAWRRHTASLFGRTRDGYRISSGE